MFAFLIIFKYILKSSLLSTSDVLTNEDLGLRIDQKPNTEDIIFNVKGYLDQIIDNIGIRFETSNSTEYSLLDPLNFRGASVGKLKELFISAFGIDLSSAEGKKDANTIFESAKKTFIDRYGKNLPAKVLNKTLTGVKDIKQLLDNTGKTLNGVFYCALAKLFLMHAIIRKDQRIIYKDSIHSGITKDITGLLLNNHEIVKGVKKGTIKIGDNEIPIILLHRPKSVDSIIGKMVGNIDYNEVDDFKDLHGYTIEMDTEDNRDIILAMQNYYHTVIQPNVDEIDIEIENKGLISLEDVEDIDGLSDDFRTLLVESIKASEAKQQDKANNKGTSHKYEDIKFKIRYKTDNPVSGMAKIKSGTEIKFTKKGNKNEHGLSFQPIFDGNKRFREITRLVGYIRVQDIINTVNIFSDKLDNELKRKGIDRDIYLQELIDELCEKGCMECFDYEPDNDELMRRIELGLFNFYEKGLLKVKSSKRSRKMFYVHKSYNDLTPEVVPGIHEF